MDSNRCMANHPIFEYIMSTPLLDHFKATMEPYDGTFDPQEHLDIFNSTVLISGVSDHTMCWIFPSTLKKSGLLWFSFLKPNSIYDFFESATKFLAHFLTSRTCRKTLASLINLRQGQHESLKHFMERFNQEELQNPWYKLGSITKWSLSHFEELFFCWFISKGTIIDLVEVMQWIVGYINMEEVA